MSGNLFEVFKLAINKLHDVSPEMYSFCYIFGVFKGFMNAIYDL